MASPNRVVLAAAGTAGHVFPALALRQSLIEAGAQVRLLCDERALKYLGDLDRSELTLIESGGLVTGSATKRARNLVRLATGTLQSRRRLIEFEPDLVVGLGGYGSVGPVLAARQLGIPSVLHEQNSVMGAANRLTARSATAVALSFDPTERSRGKCTVTGNPSRDEIISVGAAPFPTLPDGGPIGILVMGGSQGARIVSDAVPAALAGLRADLRAKLNVTHQARIEDHESVVDAYRQGGIQASVEPFVDVGAALPHTHLVISRSGATTVCDVAVARRPAIYVPLMSHRDLHQVKNAQAVVSAGGAMMWREDKSAIEDLTRMVDALLADTDRLVAMADAARAWSRPDAADAIMALLG